MTELRLIRNQVVAALGHKPGPADQLDRFDAWFPALASALGLAPDPETANAQRLVAAFASTRVDA